MTRITFQTPGPDATRNLGACLGRRAPPGTLILLTGPLGAGKTTFAQGVAAGLGIAQPVVSPTYTLIREYEVPPREPGIERPRSAGRLVHMDFYRLSGAREVVDLGLDDYLASSDIVVIEWPERASGVDLPEAINVSIGAVHGEADTRRIVFAAETEAGDELLTAVADEAARGSNGSDVARD